MSRKPLVDVERIMQGLSLWIKNEVMRAVLEDVVTKYEAALDGARKDGFDAAIADGDVLDEWKERAWQAEKKLAEAAKIIQVREDMCEGANEAIAMYKKRIADLEARYEPKGVEDVIANDPGFFNAKNMDYLNKMMHTNRLAIGWLSDRVAMLEREQNMRQETE